MRHLVSSIVWFAAMLGLYALVLYAEGTQGSVRRSAAAARARAGIGLSRGPCRALMSSPVPSPPAPVTGTHAWRPR